jgi:redox-sensitive bicupin YhaK (pirin superfamily)
MTAGSGILHQELPQPSPEMLGVQVWLNLAADNKMTEPQYGDITADMIPVYKDQTKKVNIIAGEYEGLSGEIQRFDTKPTFFDVELESESEFIFELPAEFNAYAFLIRGQANFDPEMEDLKDYPQGVLYENGEKIKVKTKEQSARFLLLAGKKLEEPVAWGGPIVMNTREELAVASRELDNGTFIKNKNEKNIEQVNKFYQED